MTQDVTAPEVDPARSPLSHLNGARPPSPAWFDHALAQTPERSRVEVEGAEIEMLAWGRRGDPGLLFLHGFAAHADWWSFIAPLLANEGRRIVASSWSGMGGSDWRDAYSMDQHAREAMAVAEAGGLFDGPSPPVVIGHSYGSFVSRLIAQDYADRLGGVILVDGPLSPTSRQRPPTRLGHGDHRIYPEFADALARFRFTPVQTCENLYIADHIARTSLRRGVDAQGRQGWQWRFDGNLRGKMDYAPVDRLVAQAATPLALIYGDRSQLMNAERLAFARQTRPPGAPWIDIPDAGHHVMVDQPLALIAALRGLLAAWPPASRSHRPNERPTP